MFNCYLCSGDLISSGVMEGHNGSLGLCDDDVDDKTCQKSMAKLIFRGTYRLSGTGIVECLKIIVIGCNLKSSV